MSVSQEELHRARMIYWEGTPLRAFSIREDGQCKSCAQKISAILFASVGPPGRQWLEADKVGTDRYTEHRCPRVGT